jgi:radical SAM protein with 4Fe4S-binding SPASM domain
MKATNLTNKNPGGKRQKLINKLPLSTPYVVQIFPIYRCNFKCGYCGVFNKKEEDRFFISEKKIMDFDLFAKSIRYMRDFPEKIKTLRFVGIGEPLLHPKIVQMIRYAYSNDIAEKIEIVTNGSLLTEKMSNQIIAVDCLDRMVISVQGLNSKTYKKVSGIKLDFDKFVANIKYFYEHKKKTHLYIKIADIALKDKDEENKFYEIFGSICDSIGIEHIVDIHTGAEIELKDNEVTQFGGKSKDTQICPLPFYFMEVRPSGAVVPCYNFEAPTFIGDINKTSLVDIWNNPLFKQIMIYSSKDENKVCKSCTMSKFRYHSEDDLDSCINKLKKLY